MRHSIFILLLFVLLGCNPMRKLTEADTTVPKEYLYGSAAPKVNYDTLWWQQLGDTLLNNLIGEAIQNNKNLRSTVSVIEVARLMVSTARGAMLPTFSLSFDGSNAYNVLQKNRQSYGMTGEMNWQINLAGADSHALKAAKAEYEEEKESYNAALLALSSEVASTYITILEYQKSIEIAQTSLALREASAALIDSMVVYGMSSALDLEQAKGLQVTAAAAIPECRRALEQSVLALTLLLGCESISPVRFERSDIFWLRMPSISAGLPSAILQNRRDIRAAEMQVVASAEKVGVAWASRFPTLSLTADGGVASSALKGVVNGQPGVWSLSGALLQPLFAFGKNKRAQQIAEENHKQAVLNYEQTILVALSEVETALSGIATYASQIEKYNLLLENNKKVEGMSRQLYKSGLNDYLYLLDAERELFASELSTVQLLSAQLINYVSFYKAIGVAPRFGR